MGYDSINGNQGGGHKTTLRESVRKKRARIGRGNWVRVEQAPVGGNGKKRGRPGGGSKYRGKGDQFSKGGTAITQKPQSSLVGEKQWKGAGGGVNN